MYALDNRAEHLEQTRKVYDMIDQENKKTRRAWLFVLMSAFLVLFIFTLFRSNDVGRAVANILSILTPIFFGIAIAYILNPVVVFFEGIYLLIANKFFKPKTNKYKKHANTVAILLAIILLAVVLSVLISSVLPQLYQTIMSLIGYVPGAIDKIEKLYNDFAANENSWLEMLGINIEDILSDIEKWLTHNLTDYVNSALKYITSGVVSVVSFLINFIIGICVAVYLLKEKNTMFGHMKKITYAVFNKQKADFIVKSGNHAKKIFGGYIYGNIVGCLIVFTATFLFMLIMRMPYVLLISTIVCLTNFIPFFGPFIGAAPSTLILLLHDPMMALYFAIFTLILQQVEGHFLTPLIISDSTGVSPFWVTFALLVGAGFFGLPGLIFSVPIFSVIYYLVKTYSEKKLQEKELSIATADYMTEENALLHLNSKFNKRRLPSDNKKVQALNKKKK